VAEPGHTGGRLARARETAARRIALVRMLGDASPWLVAVAVLAAVVAGLLPVAVMLAGGVLSGRIDTAVRHGGTGSQLHAVYLAFVLVMGLFLVSEVMVPVQSRLRWLVTKRVDGAARTRVMRAALAGTDMTRLHGDRYLEAMGLARGLIRWAATPGGGAAGMIGLTRDYLTGLSAAAVLATFQPAIAAAALVAALVVRVRWRRATVGIINVWIEGSRHRREAWYFSELGLGRPAANEARLFGLRDWIGQRIHVAGIEAWTPTWRQRRVGMGSTTALDFALTGAVAVAGLVWAARAAADDRLGVGQLVVFVPALFAVLAVGRYFNDDTPVEYGTVTLPAIETLERLAQESLALERGNETPGADTPPEIALRGVSFRYPGGGRDVLRDVDLELPAGTPVALVGMNGAGKTTLVRLLCGLYPPDAGAVLVDGVDLRELDLHAWHRSIAPMFQEFLRLPSSVFENASIGAVEALGDREGAGRALAEAGAAPFAQRLPQGPDTLLATRHADGTDLSGGQWQRLGIARALFALDHGARFLVLDEPTSNLDTASEERLVQRLLGETRGVATTLLVTHRLALARRCDLIVVVEDGRIVESGDHAALLALDGRYAAAFRMQASLYPLEAEDA
jgi:ATP-binding cassette, subfamily B, bacterial